KITQYGHGVCSTGGEACECAVEYDHPYALQQERNPASGTDSSRYLAAGAAHSYWLRTAAGELGNALPAFRRILGEAENTIVESNSILQFVKPDLYLPVLDFTVEDFKLTSLLYLDRADALVVIDRGDRGDDRPKWRSVSGRLWIDKPKIVVAAPSYVSAELADFVRAGVLT
ncbi:MAG: hypothetical protein M3Z23_05000, partial [Acidobacteriota bacterium]|nr:hypothetical protein [Acidobacteriota bacterium]